MRDPKRIYVVTAKLAELWHEFPDFRFYQLFGILKIPKELEKTDPFYWEDDKWVKIFEDTKEFYKR